MVETKLAIEIPSFPTAIGQLVSEIHSENPAINRIVQLVECEPNVAAKLIATANSPIYGARKQIRTVRHAVVILGFRTVSSMVLSIAASDLLCSVDRKFAEFSSQILTQSLATAAVGRALSTKSKWVEPDEAFLVGVMHEIGKLVLLKSLGSVEPKTLLQCSPEDEQEMFGHTHMELGRMCIEHWGLDDAFGEAIASHHEDYEAITHSLTRTLILAQTLAQAWDLEKEVEPENAVAIEQDIAGKMEIDLTNCRSAVREQFEAIKSICT